MDYWILFSTHITLPIFVRLYYCLWYTWNSRNKLCKGSKELLLCKIYIGTIIAIGGRLFSHVLSGVIFFAEYAGTQNPWIYSILYNASYLIPELIISIIVISLI